MDSVKKENKVLASCQQYLKIADIKDNTVMLKDGSVRAVIKIYSINFDLKSEQEQNSLVYSYQQFLNTLEFPIQIIIKSKKLDIMGYLEKMNKVYQAQTNDLMKNLTLNYINYVGKLVEIADIMQKEFYVVVPADPIAIAKSLNPLEKLFRALNPKDKPSDYAQRMQDFESIKKRLDQRTQSVINGFSNMGLKTERLNTYKLIELYYKCYNPDLYEAAKLNNLDQTDVEMDHKDSGDSQAEDSSQ